MEWRKKQGRPEGFETLRAHKPVIAVGAQEPLDDQKMLADYFRMYPSTLLIRSVRSTLTLIATRWKGWSRWHSLHRESHFFGALYTSNVANSTLISRRANLGNIFLIQSQIPMSFPTSARLHRNPTSHSSRPNGLQQTRFYEFSKRTKRTP